jgi:hypothetical protein
MPLPQYWRTFVEALDVPCPFGAFVGGATILMSLTLARRN